MKLTLSDLKIAWAEYQFHGFEEEASFDWINICNVKDQSDSFQRHLFFAIYDTTPQIDGWFDVVIDRRTVFPKITFDHPNWSFVIENDVSTDGFKQGTQFIVVDNIRVAAKKLYHYVFNKVNPRVCAVTGSVGKTTTVAFLEQIISVKYSCLRLYSKRISPPILFTLIINKLETTTQFIVVEYALWHKYHIQNLVTLMQPTYAVILNIKDVHLDVDGIGTRENVLKYKAKILNGSTGILNIDDPLINTLSREKNTVTFAIENKSADIFVKEIDRTSSNIIVSICSQEISINAYLLTSLTLYQILAACCIGYLVNISNQEIKSVLNHLEPKEERLVKLPYKGANVIFDGQRSLDARLDEFTKNYYANTFLIIYKFEIDFPKHLLSGFPAVFGKFNRVFILNIFDNRAQLSGLELPSNTSFVDKSTGIMEIIEPNSFVVIHYSSYYNDKSIENKDPLSLLADL